MDEAIDIHVHIGEDKDGAKQNLAQLKKNMAAYGISHAAIFPFDEKEGNLVKASERLLGVKNRQFLPFLRFDPKQVKPGQINASLSKGFYGVKLHPRAQNFDPLDRKYYWIYKEIEESGKPILFHTRKTVPTFMRFKKYKASFFDPDRIVKLAEKFPDVDFIIGHFAGLSWKALESIKTKDHLYTETSIFGTTFAVRRVAENIGIEKILFGSDSPYSDQELELLKIKKSGLGKSEISKILSGNARKLFKL
jgi:hypothetical protein